MISTSAGFTTDCSAIGSSTADDLERRSYEVVFHNETGHPLMLVSACHGANDAWVVAPPPAVGAGETVTFRVGSARRAAGGVVIYRDAVRGGLVTFCGSASSRTGSSCCYATPTDGLLVVGPQGYLPGVETHVHGIYVLG